MLSREEPEKKEAVEKVANSQSNEVENAVFKHYEDDAPYDSLKASADNEYIAAHDESNLASDDYFRYV